MAGFRALALALALLYAVPNGQGAEDAATTLIERLLAPDTTTAQHLALIGPPSDHAYTNAIHELNVRAGKDSRNGNFDLALRANGIARELATPLADRTTLGFCLIERGLIDIDRADYESAVEFCQQAKTMFQAAHDLRGEAKAANALGKALCRAGKNDEARAQFTSCREAGRDLNDRDLQSLGFSGLGEVDRQQGNFTNALQEFQASLEIDRAMTNRQGAIECLGNMANVNLALGDKKSALQLYDESLAGYRELNDKDGEALSLNNIGIVKEMTGDFTGALADYGESLKIKREIKDHRGENMTLNNIGALYLNSGQPAAALSWFKESEGVAHSNMDWANLANALGNLGGAYEVQGDFRQAISNMEASFEIETNLGNRLGAAQSRAQMAALLEETGLHTDAQSGFETALREFRDIPSPQDVAITLHNLAAVDVSLEDLDSARTNLTASLSLKKELVDQPGQVESLAGLGEVELETGHLDEAYARFHDALDLADKIGANTSGPLLGLGEVDLRRGHPDQAVDWFQKAFDSASAAGAFEHQSQAQTGIGRSQRARGHLPEAISAFRKAIAAIEEVRTSVADPSEAVGFLGRHTRPYEELALCLADSGQNEAAWKTVEGARARTLLEMLRRAGVPLAKAMTANETAKGRSIAGQLTFATLRNQIVKGQADASPDDLAAARNQLDTARQEFDDFRRTLYQNHPDSAGRRSESVPPELSALGPMLKESPLAVVEYLIGEERSIILVIRNGNGTNGLPSLSVAEMPAGRKEIRKLAQFMAEHLRQSLGKTSWPTDESAKLHLLLIAPIADLLKGASTLCVIPDGELWEIPFAALRSQSGRALIDDHAIFYTPSVSALLAMRKVSDERAKATPPGSSGPSLMVMANPSLASLRKIPNPLLGDDLEEIPGTARQARELAALFGTNAVVYTGSNATERRAKLESGRYCLLHFATHGIFVPSSPMHSGIFLTPGEGEDGFLEAHEIMDLNWEADLVVLSACESARGQMQTGEGIWGLSWAMFVAGSPSNVLTLWRVRDDSTADFMVSFYTNLLGNGNPANKVSKAEALRQAQLSLRRDPRYPHPFFWAPFVLIGDGR